MTDKLKNNQKLKYTSIIFLMTIIALILTTFSFLVFCVKADTLTVDDDGGADYMSIRNAIDNATEGDTIYIFNGTYEENLIIDKSLNITGEDREEVRIKGNESLEIWEDAITITDMTNISISSINITNWHVSQRICIDIQGTQNISITHMTFYNNSYTGIGIKSSSDVIIRNNVFTETNGISATDVQTLTVENNIIWKDTMIENTGGIFFLRCDDLSIRNNTIERIFRGMMITSCTNAVLRDNTQIGNAYSFMIDGDELSNFYHDIDISNTIDGAPIRILVNQSDVVFDSSQEYGFLGIINGTGITIKDLNLSRNGYGLLLAWVDNSEIVNNTFYGNDIGIYALDVTITKLSNLTFMNNDHSIFFDGSCNNTISRLKIDDIFGLRFVSNSHDNYVHDNQIRTFQIGIDFENSAGNRIEENHIEAENNRPVDIFSCTNTNIENNTLSIIHGVHIGVTESDNVTIVNNTILSPTRFLSLSSSEYCTIINNSQNNSDEIPMSITLGSADNNIIARHNLSGNIEYGIQLVRSKGNLFVDNLVKDNGKADMYIDRSINNTFLNTTFDSVEIEDRGESSMLVQWHLQVSVKDQSGLPLTGANVSLTGEENQAFSTVTNSIGKTDIIVINEYYRDINEIISYCPYNISAAWNGMNNYTLVDINMSMMFEQRIDRDTLPPVASIEPLLCYTNRTSFTVKWSGEDDYSGIANYTILFSGDAENWTVWIENSTLTSASWTNSSNGDTIYFYAIAIDHAGNNGSLPVKGDFQAVTLVDTSAPEAYVESLQVFLKEESFPVSWSGEDDYSGLATFTTFVSSDGEQWTPWLRNTIMTSALWSNTSHGENIFFYALAQDRAGNKGSLPGEGDSQATTTVDVYTPQSEIGPLPVFMNSTSFRINWSGEDNVSGVASYTLFVSADGENWDAWLENTVLSSAIWTNTSDGEIAYFCVAATDNAGNNQLLSEVEGFWISTIVDISPPDNPQFSTSTADDASRPTIIASFTEEVTIHLFSLDDAECTGITTPDNRTFSYTPPESLSEGRHTVTIVASDWAGNSFKSPVTWSFTVVLIPPDTTSPLISLGSPLNGTNRRPRITIISDEPVTLLSVILDDDNMTNAFTESSDNLTFSYAPLENLEIGDHTIQIKVSDGSGNTKEEIWQFTIEESPESQRSDDDLSFFVFVVIITVVLLAVALAKPRN